MIGVAFLLVAVLLIFGPSLEQLVASHAGPASGAVGWIWWIAEWPILVLGLVTAFSALLDIGPEHRHIHLRRFVSAGSLLATFVWLGASGLFAVYTASFGSYNKTWGSLAAVIVMLTWLWLAAIALLFGAELNAEVRARATAAARARIEQSGRLLVGEEAHQVGREGTEEDDRFLRRHRHARDLLVGKRAWAPCSWGVDVERIDRARDQGEEQAERGGEHEGGEEIGSFRACRSSPVHDRPPDADAGRAGT